MMIKPILSQDMAPMKAPVISHRQLISVTNNICKWVYYFFKMNSFITFLSVLDKLNDCELTRIIVDGLSLWFGVPPVQSIY